MMAREHIVEAIGILQKQQIENFNRTDSEVYKAIDELRYAIEAINFEESGVL